MINDNRYCINGIISKIKLYADGINKYLEEGNPQVEIDKINVVYPSSEVLTDFLGKSTCKVRIQVTYHTYTPDKIHSKKMVEVLMPILIDGIYVIDGKCKLPLNYIINDPECSITKDKIILNQDLYISKVNGLKIKVEDPNKYEKVDWDTIDPELLKLTHHAAKKLAILFNLEGTPEYLTPEMVARIQDGFSSVKRDNALNKCIMTPEMALLRNIDVKRSSILHDIRGKYYQSLRNKKDNTGTFNLKSLQNAIDTFFRGTDQYFTGIQNPTNANPLTFESMKAKIIFENDSTKTSKVVPYSRYDLSFYGIIDPAITPDNGNSSRVNEMTRSVVIKDGDTYIKCFTPEFELTEVRFLDYIDSRVLVSDEVDYDFEEIKSEGKYKVKYRYNEIESDSFDYIELSPDYRMSLSGSQIPMVNFCDSTRVGMGGKMINQAIGVIGGERPKVSSGNDRLISNPLVVKFEDNMGEVVEVDSGLISIKLPNGSLVTKTIPRPVKGNNNTNITFEAAVSRGDKIHRGDLLIKPSSLSQDSQLKLGINARVALMTYRGYNFEDGVIVSESFAKKMTHITIEDVKIEITPDIVLEGYSNVGEVISSTTSLMSGKKAKRLDGASKNFRLDLGLNKKFYNPWNAKCPLNIDKAVIYDMKIVEGSEPCLSDETEFLMSGRGIGFQFDNKVRIDGYPDFDQLDDQNLQLIKDFKATKGSCYTVVYRLVVYHELKLGDKVTNRFGSKGIVSLILPDSQMPYDENGNPVEVLMNPDAPLSRKNIPQTMEVEINQLMSVVFANQKSLIDEGNFDEARKNFKKYHLPQYFKMSDSELAQYHSENDSYEFITGCFSKVTPKMITEWKDELGIEPGITLWDGITRKRIRKPIMVGEMYLTKLYFLADAYAKVTSEHIPGVKSLVLGKGSVTKKGSKHGNMEMDAIMANNAMNYVKKMKSSDGSSAGWLFAHALMTGLIFKLKDSPNAEED